jgi:hypothetical protein
MRHKIELAAKEHRENKEGGKGIFDRINKIKMISKTRCILPHPLKPHFLRSLRSFAAKLSFLISP